MADVLLEIDGFARGPPDGAHAALPQQTGEPVGPNAVAGGEGHKEF
jgi:hypothetical protein